MEEALASPVAQLLPRHVTCCRRCADRGLAPLTGFFVLDDYMVGLDPESLEAQADHA